MLTAEDVDALIDEIRGLRSIVVGLQLKVAELEARPIGLHWVGVWEGQRSYKEHEGVTHGGSVWLCIKANSGKRPNDYAPEFWRLVVQRGRDGKGATAHTLR